MRYALPMIFALGLFNVSCGKSKKEEVVKSEEQDKNIDEIGQIAMKLREHALNIDQEVEIQ